MVRSAARLQADPARRQLGEELRHRTAPKLRAQHRCFGLVDPMHLKDMLGGVQTNPDNPHRPAPLLDCTITALHYRCRRRPPPPPFYSAPEAARWIPAFAGNQESAAQTRFCWLKFNRHSRGSGNPGVATLQP